MYWIGCANREYTHKPIVDDNMILILDTFDKSCDKVSTRDLESAFRNGLKIYGCKRSNQGILLDYNGYFEDDKLDLGMYFVDKFLYLYYNTTCMMFEDVVQFNGLFTDAYGNLNAKFLIWRNGGVIVVRYNISGSCIVNTGNTMNIGFKGLRFRDREDFRHQVVAK